MASESGKKTNPYTRPGFIAAAALVVVAVIVGTTVVAINATSNDSSAGAVTSTESPTKEPSVTDETTTPTDNACGLTGPVSKATTLAKAPEAEWKYQGVDAYPTSPKFGPGKTHADGYHYCFQHSPQGALFAAAAAMVYGNDGNVKELRAWLHYFVADGPHRDAILAQEPASDPSGPNNSRSAIKGFRLLAYDGTNARVDIAFRNTYAGETTNLSMVYELEWQNGDWKLHVSDPDNPINSSVIPDLSGYVRWSD